MAYDMIIKNGKVIDGSGLPGFHGDVAVNGGRIVEIGKVSGEGRQVLNADGLVVAPGIIDNHTHYDAQVTWDPLCTYSCYHGITTVVMMQYTGFLDSINAIRGVAVEGHFPVCMVVGLLGKEPDIAPTKSKKYGVKIIEPILDVMGIEHHLIERDGDVAQITPVIEKAFASSSPTAILIGREPR